MQKCLYKGICPKLSTNIYDEDMKCKFENSVNAILFLMFCFVLATISLSNCKGYCHDSNDNSNLEQTGKDTTNTDSVYN